MAQLILKYSNLQPLDTVIWADVPKMSFYQKFTKNPPKPVLSNAAMYLGNIASEADTWFYPGPPARVCSFLNEPENSVLAVIVRPLGSRRSDMTEGKFLKRALDLAADGIIVSDGNDHLARVRAITDLWAAVYPRLRAAVWESFSELTLSGAVEVISEQAPE